MLTTQALGARIERWPVGASNESEQTRLLVDILAIDRAPGRMGQLVTAEAALLWWGDVHWVQGNTPDIDGVENPFATATRIRSTLEVLRVRTALASTATPAQLRAGIIEILGEEADELECVAIGDSDLTEDGERVMEAALAGYSEFLGEGWFDLQPSEARPYREPFVNEPVSVDVSSLSLSGNLRRAIPGID